MNAIEMLKTQHRAVEDLFGKFQSAESIGIRRRIFEQIADALAIHTTIEERHFYPAVKSKATESVLREAVEEHFELKHLVADLLALGALDETLEAKVSILREDVERHMDEEEKILFSKVEKTIDDGKLRAIAAAMERTKGELLEAGNPRDALLQET